jgi:uncharacterized membrane protein
MFKQKRFVNRGFLYGPLCPIYGATAVCLIVFLTPLKYNWIYVFIGGVILASIIEYVTGFIMNSIFHTRWWDYSDEKYNIKGYICLRFSLIWGVIALIFMSIIHPNIANAIYFIPRQFGEVLYNILLVLLVIDGTSTVRSLIQFNILFNELDNIRSEIKENLQHIKENTLEKAKLIKMGHRNKSLTQVYERLSLNITFKHRSLLRAYPELKSIRFQKLIEDLKEKAKNNKILK